MAESPKRRADQSQSDPLRPQGGSSREVKPSGSTGSPGAETASAADSLPAPGGPFATLPMRFGRYDIQKELGRGMMGAVYLAQDKELDRPVALKVARTSALGSAKLLKRMEIEAKMAAKIDHPLVCKVYDAGEIDGIRFIAQQYVPGEDLKKYMKRLGRKLEPQEAVRLVLQILRALKAAHENGVIHRDLKPENIMLNKNNDPVIMDFGLARQAIGSSDAGLTQGMIVGTAAYMSPEQANGRAEGIDHRSDIYAVGVILFEMLTGEWPFKGGAIEVMGKKCVQEPPSPFSIDPTLNPKLAAVCHKMIAKQKTDRFVSTGEVVEALEAINMKAYSVLDREFTTSPMHSTERVRHSEIAQGDPIDVNKKDESSSNFKVAANPIISRPSENVPSAQWGGVEARPQSSTMKGSALGAAAGTVMGMLIGAVGVLAVPAIWIADAVSDTRKLRKVKASKPKRNENTGDTPPQLPPPPNDNNGGGSGDGNEDDSEDRRINGDSVECAVFAPTNVKQGDSVLIQVFGYLSGKEKEAKRKAKEFDEDAVRRGVTTLVVPIENGQLLQCHLSLGKIHLGDPIRVFVWNGQTASVQFEIDIPNDYSSGNLLGTVVISASGIPVGRIGFKLYVYFRGTFGVTHQPEWVGDEASRFSKAFVSYCSKDREAVIHRVQMLRPPFTSVTRFQDILGLEPGDEWSEKLYEQINDCDLFLLFWSSNAKESDWVEREWRHALKRQGPEKRSLPTIIPVIIEGPPPVPPPDELKHLHFNDYLLYLARSNH